MFCKIFAFLFVVVALVCCNEGALPENEVEIPLDPNKKYIHIDAGVSTRGALVEDDVLKDNFHVLGYQYRGDWETAKVLATPNVFDSIPELVSYNANAGVYSYETIQSWSGNTYSFFGYYPSDSEKINLFGGGAAMAGEPYIMYDFPTDSDPTLHIDVMTAEYIDTGVASSSTVQMHFKHRLCAVDVGARNYYEIEEYVDASGSTVSLGGPTPVTIEITGLYVALTNIVNTKAKIYLNSSIPTEYPNAQTKASVNYVMVGSPAWAPTTFDVKPNTASDRGIRLVTHSTGENASSLMFIPQDELVSGTVDLYYRKKFVTADGKTLYQRISEGATGETVYKWTELPMPTDDALQFYTFQPSLNKINFDKPLIEGRRYYIELTFTSDAVSVNIVAADEWNTKPDISYEFE